MAPATVCNGVCTTDACPSAGVTPPTRRGYMNSLRKRAMCPAGTTACGVYERRGARSSPFECIHTDSDLESCELFVRIELGFLADALLQAVVAPLRSTRCHPRVLTAPRSRASLTSSVSLVRVSSTVAPRATRARPITAPVSLRIASSSRTEHRRRTFKSRTIFFMKVNRTMTL